MLPILCHNRLSSNEKESKACITYEGFYFHRRIACMLYIYVSLHTTERGRLVKAAWDFYATLYVVHFLQNVVEHFYVYYVFFLFSFTNKKKKAVQNLVKREGEKSPRSMCREPIVAKRRKRIIARAHNTWCIKLC